MRASNSSEQSKLSYTSLYVSIMGTNMTVRRSILLSSARWSKLTRGSMGPWLFEWHESLYFVQRFTNSLKLFEILMFAVVLKIGICFCDDHRWGQILFSHAISLSLETWISHRELNLENMANVRAIRNY